MNKRKDYKWLVLIFIITLILLSELFINDRLYGHDTLFHAGNIINLSKTISISNIFGDNLISLSSNPFGYGTWLFYPKLPHLLCAYVYLIFKDVYFSMAFIYLITTFLSGILIYYLSKKLFNCHRMAFLSSLTYMTFSYHICEIYIRDAFAENFIFLVIPMIFLGLYELKSDNYNKFYLLFISGYVIGMYSHLISMVFCTIFVLFFLLYHRKDFFVKRKIKPFFISTIIITCLVLPFLTNIIQHKLLGDYIVFTDTFSNRYSTIFNILPISSYIIHNKYYNHNNVLVYLNYNTIILSILTFITYLLKKNKKNFWETRKFLLFSGLFLILFINSEYLWATLPEIFCTIQFPWRLMTFFCCIVSLYAPLCLYYKPQNKLRKIYQLFYIIIVIVIIGEGLNNIYYYGNKEYSVNEIKSSSAVMGWQLEYLPVNVVEKSTKHYGDYLNDRDYKLILSEKSVNLNIITDEFPNIKFEINNISDSLYIEFPRLYYYGYELYNKDSKKINVFQTDNGFVGTKISENGIYTLKYVGTIYNKISNVIRILTILTIIIWKGWFLWKKRK